MDASELVREARLGAGLSQRALAKKARTAQSVVARVELGETSPTWDTLIRLLRAAGYRLCVSLERNTVDKSFLDDVPRILRLTPEERLEEVAAASRFIANARRHDSTTSSNRTKAANRQKDRDDVAILKAMRKSR